MAERIISMRTLLRQRLAEAGSRLPWGHITDQIGMVREGGREGWREGAGRPGAHC